MHIPSENVLLLKPTFNESLTLGSIFDDICRVSADYSILMIDDRSPEGTGEIAGARALVGPHLHVLHREVKGGLCKAYLAGFQWGLARNFTIFVEMDADGSHPAGRLPTHVRAVSGEGAADLAIGSRWTPGGTVISWPLRREVLSRAGNLYACMILRIRVRDMTAGFRAYRAEALGDIDLRSVKSKGYAFSVDMTLRATDTGCSIVEILIDFREREQGHTKMSRTIVLAAMVSVTLCGLQCTMRKFRPRETSG